MKRKHLISFLLFLFVGNNIYGQNIDIINLEKVYSFLNSTMTNDTIHFNLRDQTSFGILGDNIESIFSDSLFNKEDIEYFRKQFSFAGKLKWQKRKIIGAKVISKEKIKRIFKRKDGWKRFRKKYGDCLTSFSLPLFNKDNSYCIFYQWTQCDFLAGSGSLDLYKLENGKWIFVKNYGIGIS